MAHRPYKGMQAEIEERKHLYAAATAPHQPQNDSVIEAARTCLIVGSCTLIIGIGIPFFPAAFILGIYAMATHRIKQGAIVSILAIVIPMTVGIATYIAGATLFLKMILNG